MINTLTNSRSCITAPVPGQTKVWQYVALTQKIHLIDSPGIVYDMEAVSDAEAVLKGVVRSERLQTPVDFIPAILERVSKKHICSHYGIQYGGYESSGDSCKDLDAAAAFLRLVGLKQGRLLAGGEADVISVAKIVINDFQRGKLPYFVPPPLANEGEEAEEANEEQDDEELAGEDEEDDNEGDADEGEDEESGEDDGEQYEDDDEEEDA